MNELDMNKILEAADRAHYASAADDAIPRIIPPSWFCNGRLSDGAAFTNKVSGLRVITSAAREADGKRWLHVSCSHADRIPEYEELKLVKEVFIGRDRKAIQVFASEKEHVNLNSFVLHLWCCLDGDPLPDFTRGTGSI